MVRKPVNHCPDQVSQLCLGSSIASGYLAPPREREGSISPGSSKRAGTSPSNLHGAASTDRLPNQSLIIGSVSLYTADSSRLIISVLSLN